MMTKRFVKPFYMLDLIWARIPLDVFRALSDIWDDNPNETELTQPGRWRVEIEFGNIRHVTIRTRDVATLRKVRTMIDTGHPLYPPEYIHEQ